MDGQITSSTGVNNQLTRLNIESTIDDTSTVRYCVSSLGLVCAIVSCYAQMVFCIAIVEMVMPSHDDYNNNVDSIVIYSNNSQDHSINSNAQHHTCPIDANYRSFYDEWRFNNKIKSIDYNATTTSNRQQSVYYSQDKFNWDAGQQGLLLGAFAIGAAPLQIFGGRMAEIYGAKWVLFAAGLGTAITNFLIPHIAQCSYYLLIVVRIVMGISQSGMESALMCLFAEWLAPAEASFFISMLLFAICIGGFLGSLCSAYLLTLGLGWPITYYVASGLSFVWSILWLVFATSRPHDHKLLSKQELNYILFKQKRQKRNSSNRRSSIMISALLTNHHTSDIASSQLELNNYIKTESPILIPSSPIPIPPSPPITTTTTTNNSSSRDTSQSAPWFNILTTPQVWVFIITKITVRWCADIITIELPTYLSNVLHLSIKLNGLLNSISAALFAIFSFVSGCVANKLLKTRPGKLSKTNIRKIIQGFASFGGAIGLFLMTLNDCNLLITISMLMFLSCCLVFGTGGELQIPFDMTSEYPGTLHGIACTLSVSGWLAPTLVGLVLGDQPDSRERWHIVWYSTALISLFGGIVFTLFADARPIDFTVDRSHHDFSNKKSSSDLNRGNNKSSKGNQLQPSIDDVDYCTSEENDNDTNSKMLDNKTLRASQQSKSTNDILAMTVGNTNEQSSNLQMSARRLVDDIIFKDEKLNHTCIAGILRYLLYLKCITMDFMNIGGHSKCYEINDLRHITSDNDNHMMICNGVEAKKTWSSSFTTVTHL